MIKDLRFIERETPIGDGTICRMVRILQASDGHAWFDVPLVQEEPPNEQ